MPLKTNKQTNCSLEAVTRNRRSEVPRCPLTSFCSLSPRVVSPLTQPATCGGSAATCSFSCDPRARWRACLCDLLMWRRLLFLIRPINLLQWNVFVKIRIIKCLKPGKKLVQSPCFAINDTSPVFPQRHSLLMSTQVPRLLASSLDLCLSFCLFLRIRSRRALGEITDFWLSHTATCSICVERSSAVTAFTEGKGNSISTCFLFESCPPRESCSMLPQAWHTAAGV